MNEYYFKRIEAIEFTVKHDNERRFRAWQPDGQEWDSRRHADLRGGISGALQEMSLLIIFVTAQTGYVGVNSRSNYLIKVVPSDRKLPSTR